MPLDSTALRSSWSLRLRGLLAAGLCAAGLLAAGPAAAGVTVHRGSFLQDDQHAEFVFTLAGPGTVTAQTLSFAGALAGDGSVVPAGGFDPMLSLFDASGALLAIANDEVPGVHVGTDPATGFTWDAFLSVALAPGRYTLVLTQSDNGPLGSLADPFQHDGEPTFSGDNNGVPGGMFYVLGGAARTGDWALQLTLPGGAVPEPGVLLLALAGLGLVALRRRA